MAESLVLVQFPRGGYPVPNLSPFCVKAEVLMKMSGLAFTVEDQPDPRKGPKGKMPVLRDGAKTIGDSELIRQHLEKAHGVDFDTGLSEADKAVAHAFARMLEERFYWVIIQNRWMDDTVWPEIREHWFGALPFPMNTLLPLLARGQVRRNLQGQGTGKHAQEQIYDFGVADLAAVSAFLAEKPFMMGEEPTSVDATVFGMLAILVDLPFPSPMKDFAETTPNLRAYRDRSMARWYPELTGQAA